MRKISKSFVLLLGAAVAFISCGKENTTPEPSPVEGTIRVKFAADAALTKVALTPDDNDANFSASWNDEDEISITSYLEGEVYEENVTALWNGESFETDFDVNDYSDGSFQFVGVWPVGKNPNELFPAERHQKGAEYNGYYDIMRSNRTSPASLSQGATIVLDMVRQTSIAYFHITSGLNEKIVSATLTADKPIASSNATISNEGFEPNTETAGENSIKLIIDGEMYSSDFKLWFNVLPVQYETMTLRVETKNHSFTLSKKTSGEWKVGELNKTVITNVPAEKWAEIERPAGEVTNTLTMDGRDGHTYTTSDGIITATFVNNGGQNPPYWEGSELRMYQKNKLTVSASDENIISRIEYYANKNYKSGNIPVLSVNVGELDKEDFVWTGSSSSVVLSFSTNSGNYGFTSLKVTYTDPNASSDPIYKYSVMVDKNVTNGTVTVDKTSAKEGDEVTITATPSDGYELVAGSVKAYNAVSGAELTVTNNKFTMPAANVNVTASFYLIPTLSATSPEPYSSNLTNNGGEGYSISVTSNQKWSAAFKDGDLNAAGITLMTSAGEGDGAIVFKFNEKNLSVVEDKTTTITLSAESGSPAPIDLTITHKKLGAAITLSADQNVEASSTSTSFQVSSANFEWSVLSATVNNSPVEFKEASDPSAGDYTYSVTPGEGYKATITVNFPSNAAVSETTFDRTIAVTVGMAGVKTATHKITQSGETYVDPNQKYYVKVTSVPAVLNGKYIIAYGTTAYDAIGTDRLTAASGTLSISDNRIEQSDAVDALAVTIYGTTNHYYIQFPDAKFLSVKDENSAVSSEEVFYMNNFSVSDNVVTIQGHDGTQNRVLVNNNNKIAFYKNVGTYTLPTLYRLEGSESDVVEAKQFKVESAGTSVTSEGGDKTITITASSTVAWTAEVTGAATLSSYSGLGSATLTVTIPRNDDDVEKSYFVTVKTTDNGVPVSARTKEIKYTQPKAGSNGKGSTWQSISLYNKSSFFGTTAAAKNLSPTGVATMNWSCKKEGTGTIAAGSEARGLQLQANAGISMSTTAYTGGIESITLELANTNSRTPTVTITVDGVSYTGSTQGLSGTAASYTFKTADNSIVTATGKTVYIKVTTSASSVYVKTIKIN